MDTQTKPGDDFFRYANGAWLDVTEIPADRANWGTSPELIELTNARVADLIKTAATAPAASEAAKVGAFYSAYMDETEIDAWAWPP